MCFCLITDHPAREAVRFDLSRAARLRLIVGALAILTICCVRFWPRPAADDFKGLAQWSPTQEDIARTIGKGDMGGSQDWRHRTFARLFQQRYRNRFVIVGMKFLNNATIMVQCVSSIPRPIMARIALSAHRETEALFGKEYAVHLFEMNGLGKRKLAEVRKNETTGEESVVFDPRFARESLPPNKTADQIVPIGTRNSHPPIFQPSYVPADRAEIRPGAYVIGFEHDGEAHAYALNLMDSHELVNDVVGGKNVLVSWCSLCHTAIVYSRDLDGRTLTFGMTGELLNNAMVMYDRETNSRWSQVTGKAIGGKLKGKHLKMLVGMPRITWAAWRKLHPRTVALSVHGKEDAAYDNDQEYEKDPNRIGVVPFRKLDRRARPKEMVLGIVLEQAHKAYPLSRVYTKRLIEDRVGGTPVLVWSDRGSAATAVYERPGRGTYRLEGDVIVGPGGRWQAATGRSLSGRRNLTPIPYTPSYWFGWSAFYPRTGLYGG
jgi:hypothetical protein